MLKLSARAIPPLLRASIIREIEKGLALTDMDFSLSYQGLTFVSVYLNKIDFSF